MMKLVIASFATILTASSVQAADKLCRDIFKTAAAGSKISISLQGSTVNTHLVLIALQSELRRSRVAFGQSDKIDSIAELGTLANSIQNLDHNVPRLSLDFGSAKVSVPHETWITAAYLLEKSRDNGSSILSYPDIISWFSVAAKRAAREESPLTTAILVESRNPFDVFATDRSAPASNVMAMATASLVDTYFRTQNLDANAVSTWIYASVLRAAQTSSKIPSAGILLSTLEDLARIGAIRITATQAEAIRSRLVARTLIPLYKIDAINALKEAGLNHHNIVREFGLPMVARSYRTGRGHGDAIRIGGVIASGLRRMGYDESSAQTAMLMLEIGSDISRSYENRQ